MSSFKDESISSESLKIEFPVISRLSPHEANSRLHCDEQISQIMASMVEFGWTRPVVVDERYTILAGHGAVMAAARLYGDDREIRNVPFGTA